MKLKYYTFLIFLIAAVTFAKSQNQNNNWYFGQNAGLSFATNPPTILTGSAMDAWEGTSVASDANGNLLFYTDGMTVWNQLHQVMANGTGLLGSGNSVQAALIAKKPNSNGLYYIFTVDASSTANGLMYHEVDMNLAAGLGSVTAQNIQLFTPSTEQLAGTRHCNGTDVWVMAHESNNTNNFRAYLVTAAGVNTTGVLSQVGFSLSSLPVTVGSMKFSENGKKLMLSTTTSASVNPGFYELSDFDPATGVVSNPLNLGVMVSTRSGEFSNDGSKFYGCAFDSITHLCQWDLCAGSDAAVVASLYKTPSQYNFLTEFLRASNDKIYIATGFGEPTMAVVNNPNGLGAACGYTPFGQSLLPNLNRSGVPNFITGYNRKSVPFTYVIDTLQSCQTVHFNGTNACQMKLNPVQSLSWNFGDPASGNANVSNLNSASHIYSSVGTYTVQLVLNYTCYSDTVNQVINIPALSPQLLINNSISNQITVCSGNTVNLLASGANSYSWSTGQTSSSISISPPTNATYTLYGRDSISGCASQKNLVINLSTCADLNNNAIDNVVNLFPNPSEDETIVYFETTLSTNGEFFVEIFSQLGIKILQLKVEPSINNRIDLVTVQPGLYTVSLIKNGKRARSMKLLVVKS